MSESETRTTEVIPEWKEAEVAEIVDLLERYDSVGVVDVTGIPSRQLQEMRATLHGRAQLRISRNTLLVRALEHVDEGIETLVDRVTGQVGLILTDENPFSLYQTLEETKTAAPINAGEVAPNDIVIEEGDTGIDPGPFVGELQNVGADARIQEGSIQVLSDSVVCEAGDEVSPDLSNVLNELGIEPKEVGLDLRAVYADGVLFEAADLALDVDEYRADVETAAARARNLSVASAYPTAETAPALLGTARGEAKSLALQAHVESPDVAGDLVNQADAQVRALAAAIDDQDALPEALRDLDTAVEQADDDSDTESDDADTDAEDAPDADEDSAEDADDGDDEDEDGGDALGEMFG